jgi:hypothetical protein
MLCKLLLLLYIKINALKISEEQPEGLARNSLKFSERLLKNYQKHTSEKNQKSARHK